MQFYVHKKIKFVEQILDLQVLKDRYPQLKNLPSQSYNLNEVQVILVSDCSDIQHPLEFKKSDDRTAPWKVKSKISWVLTDLLQAKQAVTLATTATSVSEDMFAGQLSKWWDIKSYASSWDITGHSKDKQRAIKTLEQTFDSPVEDTKLDFYGERRKWSYQITSTLPWGNSISNNAYRKVIPF